MEAVAVGGGQSDFEEFQSDDEISFTSVDDLLAFLTDACIHLANVPLPSGSGADYEKAAERVYQTALFQSIVEHIQGSLKTALTAAPEQYPEFRADYRDLTLIPKEHIPGLMEFQSMYM